MTTATLDPCERCGYLFDWMTRSACPVCGINQDEVVWPCDPEDWEFFGDGDPYPTDAQLDAWRADAVRRMNVEQGRQPLLFETGGGR